MESVAVCGAGRATGVRDRESSLAPGVVVVSVGGVALASGPVSWVRPGLFGCV